MAKSKSETFGPYTLRLLPQADGWAGVVIGANRQTGETIYRESESELRKALRAEAGKLHPNYFGYDGAVARFLRFFREGGFRDPLWNIKERGYKIDVARKAAVLLDEGADVAIAAIPSINLLSQFESARLSDTLRGPSADAYLDAMRQLFHADITDTAALNQALRAGAKAIEPHGRPSWPLLTLLPFLWDWERHMFLKPVATLDYAQRVGHDFAVYYDSVFEAEIYQSLLDLKGHTATKIQALKPADGLDIQGFIWTVGNYGDAELDKTAEERAKYF